MTREEEIRAIAKEVRRAFTPSSKEHVKEIVKDLGLRNLSSNAIRRDFDRLLRQVHDHSLPRWDRHEHKAYVETALPRIVRLRANVLKPLLPVTSLDEIIKIVKTLYADLWILNQSRSQSRKSMGGNVYQKVIAGMFELAEIPFEEERRKYRVDLYLPSREESRQKRTKAILLSVKRTLKERWREVTEELYNTRSPNVYLATTDEKISKGKVKSIVSHNVHLLVWDEVKHNLPSNPNVVSWTEFISKELPTFEKQWKIRYRKLPWSGGLLKREG